MKPREAGGGRLQKREREDDDAAEENEGVKSRVVDNRADSMGT